MGWNDDPDQIYTRLARVFMIWMGIEANKTKSFKKSGLQDNTGESSGYGVLIFQVILFAAAHIMQSIQVKDLNQFTVDGNQ